MGVGEQNRESVLGNSLTKVMFAFLLSILFEPNSPKFNVILKPS